MSPQNVFWLVAAHDGWLLPGFYLVLPSFTGFYLIYDCCPIFYPVLPSFTEFYLVLPSFSFPQQTITDWCYSIDGCHPIIRVLLGFTGFYLVFLGFTRFYLFLPSFT